MYVIGQTGAGKSTLLLNLIAQDAEHGRGFAVFDPHADSVERVLDLIPSRRINETVYVNPADLEWPVAFNVLDARNSKLNHLAASGLVLVFKKIWPEFWEPRLEYVLRSAILALLENPDQTLFGIPRLLTDELYRIRMLKKIQDPVVRTFWSVEYELYPKTFRTEVISPIQNKVGAFLSTPIVRKIVGQTRTKFSLRQIMDESRILLLNLAKGRIGEDNAALLGALMLTQLQLAAQSRAQLSEGNRVLFAAYIDEFPTVASDSFSGMLSESRKYGLHLVLAHQYLEKLPDSLRAAVFGNVGTIISFRIGPEDARFLQYHFGPTFGIDDLIALPAYNVYLKLSTGGRTSEPFSATTFPPPTGSYRARDKIIDQSRLRSATSRQAVGNKLTRWFFTSTSG